MSDIAITFTVLGIMVAAFVSNRVPVAPVALLATLSLYLAGVLDLSQTIAGFGDSAVLFIASLFVVGAGLQASGVAAWAGQKLILHAGDSRARLLAFIMLLAAVLTALIGTTGAVAALLPAVVLAALRLDRAPSQLMMPLAFGAHAGMMLTLTGNLANVLVSDAAVDLGLRPLGFFTPALVGIPLLAGAVAITVLFGDRLLPTRSGRFLPPDLSRHPGTLARDYQLTEGLHQFEIGAGSPYAGMAPMALQAVMRNSAERGLIAIQPRDPRAALLRAGDRLLMRGEPAAIAAFAAEKGLLEVAGPPAPAAVQQALFNASYGLAEAQLPPRSKLIGDVVFPGMMTESGDLMILGIQRRGEALGPGKVTLAAGDTLLLQGSWDKLEHHLRDPDVLAVSAPEAIRSQAVPLGRGSRRAVGIVVAMVAVLATGALPNVAAALIAACAVVLLGVLTPDQAFRAVKLGSLIPIAAMLPIAVAMYDTGAAYLLADLLVSGVGAASASTLLASLFILAALLAQVMSSTAAALIVIPIARVAAEATGTAPMAAMMSVAVGASACYLIPIASSATLMVQGPGGYRFGDYWKLGLPLLLWSLLVATFLVPLFWPAGR